jgi:hypothetical protein
MDDIASLCGRSIPIFTSPEPAAQALAALWSYSKARKKSGDKRSDIIELRKSNGTLSILLHPPHPPLSPDYGGAKAGSIFCILHLLVSTFPVIIINSDNILLLKDSR